MVIVIGATGFIGMYTVKAFLAAGKKVIATGRNEVLGKKLVSMVLNSLNWILPTKMISTNSLQMMLKELFYLQDFFLLMQRPTWTKMKMPRNILKLMFKGLLMY